MSFVHSFYTQQHIYFTDSLAFHWETIQKWLMFAFNTIFYFLKIWEDLKRWTSRRCKCTKWSSIWAFDSFNSYSVLQYHALYYLVQNTNNTKMPIGMKYQLWKWYTKSRWKVIPIKRVRKCHSYVISLLQFVRWFMQWVNGIFEAGELKECIAVSSGQPFSIWFLLKIVRSNFY